MRFWNYWSFATLLQSRWLKSSSKLRIASCWYYDEWYPGDTMRQAVPDINHCFWTWVITYIYGSLTGFHEFVRSAAPVDGRPRPLFWLPAWWVFGFSVDHQHSLQCTSICKFFVLIHVWCSLFSVGNKLTTTTITSITISMICNNPRYTNTSTQLALSKIPAMRDNQSSIKAIRPYQGNVRHF